MQKADGRVAYHGGAGPHFFALDEWKHAMAASVNAFAAPSLALFSLADMPKILRRLPSWPAPE
jgi:hypothetical protein